MRKKCIFITLFAILCTSCTRVEREKCDMNPTPIVSDETCMPDVVKEDDFDYVQMDMDEFEKVIEKLKTLKKEESEDLDGFYFTDDGRMWGRFSRENSSEVDTLLVYNKPVIYYLLHDEQYSGCLEILITDSEHRYFWTLSLPNVYGGYPAWNTADCWPTVVSWLIDHNAEDSYVFVTYNDAVSIIGSDDSVVYISMLSVSPTSIGEDCYTRLSSEYVFEMEEFLNPNNWITINLEN